MLFLIGMAVRFRRREFVALAVVYAFTIIILMTPVRPGADQGIERVNWAVIRLGIVAAAVPVLLVYRNPYVWLAALTTGVFGVSYSDAFKNLVDYNSLSHTGQTAMLWAMFGFGVMVLYCLYGSKLHRFIAVIGAAALTLSALILLREIAVPNDWMISLGLIVLGGVAFWRTKDWIAPAILSAPVVRAIYFGVEDAHGWRYMILGFLLLGLGALWSVRNRTRILTAETAGDVETQA
jgi:hypothetical protein